MIKEILSNNFNINIHKEGVNPPSTSEVISNNFNININKIIYVPLESISLNPKNYVLNTEQTLKLEVTFTPEHATNKNVIFSSSNTRVATVDETGLVTPLDAGDVIITAVSEDGNKVATSNITVVKLVTSISDVVVGNTDSNGNYKLTYIVSNFKEDSLVHRLKIGNNNYITINPNRSGNIYTYNGSGLSLGEYTCTIHVSDGYNNLTSNPFKIIIPDKEDGIKPLLKQAKDNYDAKYEILKLTISSIIEDGIFNEEEKEIIKNARIEYDESLANFNKVSQQCIDAIASKKADDAETNSKKHTEAEIKVVSDAISLKVSQTEYDSNNQVISNKFSELTQTVDEFEFKFGQSGGENILSNSTFEQGIEGAWYPFHWRGVEGECHKAIGSPINWIPTGMTGLRIAIPKQTTVSEELGYGIGQSIKLKAGTTYTVSGYSASHRVTKFVMELKAFKNDVLFNQFASWNIRTGGGDHTLEGMGERWKYQFTTPNDKDIDDYCIVFWISGCNPSNPVAWLSQLQIEEGVIGTTWKAKANEIHSNITSINKDGVKVSMSDGEGSQGSTRLGYDGLIVYGDDGKEVASFGQGNSATIGTLNVDKIYSDSVVKVAQSSAPTTLYVSPSSSGDGTGKDISNQANSINKALNWYASEHGKYLNDKMLVVKVAAGNYSDNVYVKGWLGTYYIDIQLDPGVIHNGMFAIEGNTVRVYVKGGRTNNDTNNGAIIKNTGQSQTFLVKDGWAEISNLRCTSSNTNAYFLFALSGARVQVKAVDVVRHKYFTLSYDCSHVAAWDNRGGVEMIYGVQYGGTLSLEGSCPTEKGGSWESNAGKVLKNNTTKTKSLYEPGYDLSGTNPPPAPPPSSWKWFENSFNATNLRSIPEGSGSGTSSRTGEMGQGKWGSYKPHRGYGTLGSDISSWANGGRNFTVWITMTRLNTSHGYTGAVPSPKIKQPNGSFWNSNVKFARGETKTIQLPSDIASAIASGSMKTIELWAGTSTNDYSFYNKVSIKIKCEKQV